MNAPDSLLVEGAIESMLELVDSTPSHGCIVEVGVYKGGSAWHLARAAAVRGVALHLFDTFTGIPEKTDGRDNHNVGDFSDTNLTAVQAALAEVCGAEIAFHIGMFPFTMPDPDELRPISFIHADADQYNTTREIIWRMTPLLAPDGIILFDDYGCLPGATQAVDELLPTGVQLTKQGKAYWRKP